jgi:hypothetical protein
MTTRTLASSLLLLALLACSATEAELQRALQAAAVESEEVTLASWNIEHLAEVDGEGCRPRTTADYAELSQFVGRTFDEQSVVALQEVENAAAVQRVFPAERFATIVAEQSFPALSSRCGAGNGGGNLRLPQRAGFAIGSGVSFRRNADLEELNTSRVGEWPLRVGVDVTIETSNGPLRLLAVHLKSGCPRTDGDMEGESCIILRSQIDPLERWVEERAVRGERFAILGDFNRRLAFDDPTFWRQIDDGDPLLNLRIVVRHLVSPVPRQTCPSHPNQPFIDHIVLSADAASRYVPES